MNKPRLVAIAVLSILLAGGAVQELIVRGINGGDTGPLIIGVIGICVAMDAIIATLFLWRRHPAAPIIGLVAGVAMIAFHAFAALPPERYAGVGALAAGILSGLLLIWAAVDARSGSFVTRRSVSR